MERPDLKAKTMKAVTEELFNVVAIHEFMVDHLIFCQEQIAKQTQALEMIAECLKK